MSGAQPLTAHERYFFDLYGYVVRYGALTDDELDDLLGAVARLNVPPPGNDLGSQRFVGFLEREQPFRDLLDHEAILGPILEMCGPKARLDHAYGITMTAGTGGLGLHGGGTPHDPAQFYEVRGNQMYNGLVAVQWALVDHARGEGGFLCVPGSHRANFGRPEGHPANWAVEIPLQAGDVVIFTEALTHGTSPWRAEHDRLSMLYKYAPGHSTWGTQYQTTLASLAAGGLLTDRQRKLMQIPAVYPHEDIR
ncbi:MAG TPA: phytanoyl-CoA dioxygenase family protein [Ilumatobacter sp.]|nr:phytanoyl-CoA dioxygenase family protein [Ilumatobacter sp.]